MVAVSDLERDGFAVVENVLGSDSVEGLREAVGRCGARAPAGNLHGIRDLFRAVPATATLARSAAMRDLVEAVLGPKCFAVRAIYFDKPAGANWKVPWHQDLTIAVRERRDVVCFRCWSLKRGVVHVQPPAELLGRMIAIRIHLDDCDEYNGPLRVIPGSHRHGRLGATEIDRLTKQGHEAVVTARSGGAALMRPLLLHASSPAVSPRHRRVLHFEFAAEELQGGLEWYERIA